MPKKLTMFGVLAALVFGALAVFQGGTAKAAPGPVQGFDSTGAFSVNAGTCWDQDAISGNGEEHPTRVAGQVVCGAGTSEFHVPAGTGAAVRSFTFIQLPQGNRLTLPITFTPSGPGQFGTDATKAQCNLPLNADGCDPNTSSPVGEVTAEIDALCSGPAYDVLASLPPHGTPSGWPDNKTAADSTNYYQGYTFTRTAAAGVTNPIGANAYVTQISPFPSTFGFVSLDTASLDNIYLGGGGAGFPIGPPPSPLQLYTASSAYAPTVNVSVALLAGNPQSPPTNSYLCLDSPQNSETSTEYVVPPTANGLYARWVIFTSAADFVNGAVNRILDLQCVGVGSVTAVAGGADGDADDDCLTVANGDTNDANPDQDGDGLPDGVEAAMGSNMNVADADADGVNDYTEMFQFTNPNNADTDGDGSLDKQDNGADENAGTITVDDTIADDNCPAKANPDQLNTDSAPSYHGGNDAWANTNAGTTAPLGPPATTLITSWASATINVAGTTATVTTSSTHNLALNQLVEISGVTGVAAGNATQNNAYRQSVNIVTQVKAPSGTTFTYPVAAGTPAGAATGTVVIRPATSDITNPDQDTAGDACDTDDDNDGIVDGAEGNVTYKAIWAGAGDTSCLGDGTGVAGAIALKTTNGDSDQDMVLDGVECTQGSRPDIAATSAAPCTPASAGCATPKSASPPAVEDPDGDGLYGSGVTGSNLKAENFYHTGNINLNNTSQVTDIDGDGTAGTGDKDSDADWNYAGLPGSPSASVGLQDGLEVRFYGTDPSNGDTDTDGCDDGREIADVNGDRTVSSGDGSIVSSKQVQVSGLDNGKAGDPVSGDGQVNPYGINFDVNKDKQVSSGDGSLVSFYIAKGSPCQNSRQQGLTVGNATKLPF